MALLGLVRACSANNGGGAALYLVAASEVTSMTKGTGVQSYKTITMATGKVFKKYEFEEDICSLKQTVEANKGAYKVTNVIEVDFGKLDLTQRNAMQELLDANNCGFISIFVSNNGDMWVIGYDDKDNNDRPLRITGTAGDTKTDMMEPTNNMVTFTHIGRELPRTFTGTVPV